jgi:outer membrane murein-binding lipoprotein Lpp
VLVKILKTHSRTVGITSLPDMINALILSVVVLFLLVIAGCAWIFVIRYVLSQKMQQLETDSTKLAVFEISLNELKNKPDTTTAGHKELLERMDAVEIAIRGIKREGDSREESLRRLIAKNAARETRKSKLSEEEEEEITGHAPQPSAVGVTPNGDFEALAAQGLIKPWPGTSPNGHSPVAPPTFGQFPR